MNRLEAHWWSRGNERLSRRSLLIGTGIGGLGLAAGLALGCEDESEREPKYIFTGNVTISVSDKLHVRTSPRREELGRGDNIISWSNIISINGVRLNGTEAILIERPGIVDGEDPTGRERHSPWIQITAEVKGSLLKPIKAKELYINMTSETWPYVDPDLYGEIIPVTKRGDQYITGRQGSVELIAPDVGKVTIIPKK